MTPLEAMAKAHWADSENTAWENLLPEDRDHMISVMRSALLALAEADVAKSAASVSGPSAMRVYQDDRIGVFRSMLRSIAEVKE